MTMRTQPVRAGVVESSPQPIAGLSPASSPDP